MSAPRTGDEPVVHHIPAHRVVELMCDGTRYRFTFGLDPDDPAFVHAEYEGEGASVEQWPDGPMDIGWGWAPAYDEDEARPGFDITLGVSDGYLAHRCEEYAIAHAQRQTID